MLQFAKTKPFRVAAVLLLLIGLYALTGFVLAPKLIRSAVMQDVPKAINATPAVGEIHFNPFLFQLEVKDFSLASPTGEKLLGFARLFVDFELSSLWHRAYSFANIDIGAPYISAVVARDGALNLVALEPKAQPSKPTEKKEAIPRLRVRSFKVSDGLVSYDDRSRPSAFAARMQPINFELQNFTTGVDGGKFTFTGSSKLGERVEWHGHLSVQPIESDGEFQIDGLKAHTIWEYLEDRLSFAVDSGSIDLNATYQFSLKDTVALNVDVSTVEVTDLAVKPKDSDVAWVTVPKLLVSGTHVDLGQREAHVDSLAITGLKLLTWIEPDGSINLMQLAALGPAEESSAPRVPTVTASAPLAGAPTAAPWKFALHTFELRDASIAAEDRATKPTAKVLLAPLSAQVDGASLDLTQPVTVKLQTKVNESGDLSIGGELTPQPVGANLEVKLNAIDLSAAQPYIGQLTSMTLLAGRLSGDTQVHYGSGKPALQLTGDVSIGGLHTIDNALHDDLINWERLDVKGLKYQQGPTRLDIDQVVAQKLYARVIIEPDTTLNVTRVLAGPGATVIAPAAAGSTASPIAVAAAAPPKSARVKARRKARAAAVANRNASQPAGPAMPLSVNTITVHAGQANFADLSVTPNFSTGIQALEGTIKNLSSKPNSRATLDLHGSVDAFSPVSITGELNMLGAPFYADVAMSFNNMELTTFNPYSGKFAGYNISKGKLTTELHYKVDGRKLDAQHHIVVDQLEFGDKTVSKDAVSLPIKLAVALLKDRNGVIDLDIPVTGSLDDPKFRLGPIIWEVFVHILEKAVTAPFALLGRLFGGGPDLQFIDFAPGASDLDQAGADKVHTIVQALSERPQLKIEVPIAAISELDGPALIETRFMAEVSEAQAGGSARNKPPTAALPYEQLTSAAKVDLLTPLYAKDFGGVPKYPEVVTTLKGKADIAAAKADFLSHALHEHIAVGVADLDALGQARALAVQQALLTGTQIAPERVFLVANDKAKAEDGHVRLELSLQ